MLQHMSYQTYFYGFLLAKWMFANCYRFKFQKFNIIHTDQTYRLKSFFELFLTLKIGDFILF
jgi:hypothetical protein